MSERVVPFYLVCDESYSMRHHLDELNRGLRELHHAIGTDPVVADVTRFCLMGFSNAAEVLSPLRRLDDVTNITQLRAKAASCFGAAFTALRETIAKDVDLLEDDGHSVCRPAVFFLSDGQPTDPDDWTAAHDWLMDPSWAVRPRVVAFGVDDADAAVVGRVGTYRAFLSASYATSSAALGEFCRMLITSMVRSGTSVVGGGGDAEGALLVPRYVSGFTSVSGAAAPMQAGFTPDLSVG